MTSEDETAVISTAQSGDQRAQDELVAGYLPLVYNIVGRALHGHADVDDVVQETMLRALDGLASLRDPHRFRAWLVAVTMNEIRRHWRSRQTSPPDTGIDEVAELADPGADFVDLTIIRLGLVGQRQEVAEATRWLDEDDRALLSLWWLEAAGELTRSEVAAALKLPSQFAAVRVQRMKAQLEAARVVVRALSAAPRCRRLEPVVARWDGVPSALWRKRIARHTRDCRACSGHRSDLIPAQSLLVGLALVPPTAGLAWWATQGVHSAATINQMTQLASSSGSKAGNTTPVGAHHGAHRLHGRGGRRPGSHRRPRLRPRGASGALAGGAAVTAAAAAISIALGSPGGGQKIARTEAAAQPPLLKSAPIPSPPLHPSHQPTHRPTTSPPRTPAAPPHTAEPSPSLRPTPPPSTTPPPQPAAISDAAQQVLTVINRARAANGLPPYTITTGLTRSAQAHNATMDNGCGLSHQCPGEAPLGDRETAQGVQWGAAGENIGEASAGPDPQQIATAAVNLTQGMLNEKPPNDGHRQNILSSAFTHVGIAVYRDPNGTVWLTQDFSN